MAHAGALPNITGTNWTAYSLVPNFLSKAQLLINQLHAGRFNLKVFVNCTLTGNAQENGYHAVNRQHNYEPLQHYRLYIIYVVAQTTCKYTVYILLAKIPWEVVWATTDMYIL